MAYSVNEISQQTAFHAFFAKQRDSGYRKLKLKDAGGVS